ncbi:MAG TPA: cupin domain-containing protein, partial [Ilumatobacteraceae bacterium]|nr:cupin domain-containing protein [Ilumatobacteraceae bacterium]
IPDLGAAMYQRALRGHADTSTFGSADGLWDHLLRRGARSPGFRMVRGGSSTSLTKLTRSVGFGNRNLTDVVASDKVIDEYRSGATAVLQGLHVSDPHLAKLATNLALALDQPIQVNAYLSPPQTHGLDLHYDYHDVFVVQLDGAKRWRVWDPIARTVNPSKSRPTAKLTLDELGSPVIDTIIRAGDTMYVPRGAPHAAETVDQHSVHLTVGMPSISWDRVIQVAMAAEVASGGLTVPLPTNLLDDGVAAPIDQLDVQRLPKHLDPNVLRHWMAREIWRRMAPTRLRPIHPAAPPTDGAELSFTPGPLIWLTGFGERCVLSYGNRRMELPTEAAAWLTNVLNAPDTFRADDIDGLDTESRRVVIARLIDEGVLVAR